MTAARVAFRPRRRLRHLRAIQLHGPDFGDALGAGGVGQAFYRLSTAPAAPSENGGTLLYTSEKVDLTSQPEWDPVDIDWHALGRDAVHGAHSGRLRLSVFAVPGRPAAGGEACRDAEKVLDVVCDLNALPALGSAPTPSNTALIKLSDGWYCVPPERDDAEDAAKTAVVHKALWPKPSPPKEDAPANEDVDQGQSLAKEEGGLIRSFLPRRLWRHVPSFGHLNEAARSLSDYSDPETHSASAPSPRSSSPNQSTGAENGRSRGTSVYDVAERRADIRRLITARKALNDVVERHQRLQRYVSEMLAERKRRHDQMKELAELRQEAETYRRQSEVAQQHLESAAAAYPKKRSSQCSNGAVMGEAARALKGACSRWQEAECVLQGENGLGQLRGLSAQLISRRCRLVMGLSKLYSVGPRSGADPMLQARALDEKIDRQWWMGSDAAQNPTSFAEIERNQQSGLLSVVGLDLPPGLVKQVVDGLMGWSSDPDQCQRTAAALGYVAHMVHLLGLYLDVPPRFPIYPKGSRSLIYNCAPAEDHMDVQGNGWLTSRPWRKSPTSPGRPVAPEVFPLYYQGTDRSRFAYAIYLLDKDIEQLLNAHGIKPTGPSYVLQSFYSLVAAASSALSNPGLWPSCQRRS